MNTADAQIYRDNELTGVLWSNSYQCPHCGSEWQDVWDCHVDEDCGACGLRHISPFHSEEI